MPLNKYPNWGVWIFNTGLLRQFQEGLGQEFNPEHAAGGFGDRGRYTLRRNNKAIEQLMPILERGGLIIYQTTADGTELEHYLPGGKWYYG